LSQSDEKKSFSFNDSVPSYQLAGDNIFGNTLDEEQSKSKLNELLKRNSGLVVD